MTRRARVIALGAVAVVVLVGGDRSGCGGFDGAKLLRLSTWRQPSPRSKQPGRPLTAATRLRRPSCQGIRSTVPAATRSRQSHLLPARPTTPAATTPSTVAPPADPSDDDSNDPATTTAAASGSTDTGENLGVESGTADDSPTTTTVDNAEPANEDIDAQGADDGDGILAELVTESVDALDGVWTVLVAEGDVDLREQPRGQLRRVPGGRSAGRRHRREHRGRGEQLTCRARWR